jgi:dipeptidyl-peptidase-4
MRRPARAVPPSTRNVPISATLQLVNALIAADKDFDLVIMTNSNHGLGDNPHFIRRRWDFFVRHLYGIEPPAQFRLQARAAAQAATGN